MQKNIQITANNPLQVKPMASAIFVPRGVSGLFRTLSLLALLICPALAQGEAPDTTLRLSQYIHKVWRMREGALPGTLQAVVQDAEGYLWFATSDGPYRFDGLNFRSLKDVKGVDGKLPVLTSINITQSGDLWLGTVGGVFSVGSGASIAHRVLDRRINALVTNAHGDLWAARSRILDGSGIVCKVSPDIHCVVAADGLTNKGSNAIAFSPSETMWVGTQVGVTSIAGNKISEFKLPIPSNEASLRGTTTVLAISDDDVWIGSAMA